MKQNNNQSNRSLLLRMGKLLLILGASLMLTISAFAQETDSPDGPGLDPDAPFDGGISLLVAAGIAYGVKQRHKDRSNNEGQEVSK